MLEIDQKEVCVSRKTTKNYKNGDQQNFEDSACIYRN